MTRISDGVPAVGVPPRDLVDGMNGLLPRDVSVLRARRVGMDFHATHSATGKLYRYVLRQGPGRSALRDGRVLQVRYPLDLVGMERALGHLVGEHDFSTFRARRCAARSPVRHIHAASIRQVGDEVWIEIHGAGFLRHMVRIIVGSLMEVGRHHHPPDWLKEILVARDRTAAGKTARACGLYLVRVDYPKESCLSP